MHRARGTQPQSSTMRSALESCCWKSCSWRLTWATRRLLACSFDNSRSLTSFGFRSVFWNVLLVVITNVTFCRENILTSRKKLRNNSRSSDSMTPSALSRTKVTCSWICLLQSLSHCPGFSGTCVLTTLRHELIISIVVSLKVVFDDKLQNNTVLSFSGLANSQATRFATVVFPNPGPPLIRITGAVPLWTFSLMSCIWSPRPITCSSDKSSGRQLESSETFPIFSSSFSLLHCSSSSSTKWASWSMVTLFKNWSFFR